MAALVGAAVFSLDEGGSEGGSGGAFEIDPAANEIVQSLPLARPTSITLANDSVWIVDDVANHTVLVRLRSGIDEPLEETDLGLLRLMIPDALAFGGGAAWVALSDGVYRIDPGRRGARRRVRGLSSSSLTSALEYGAGALWVADGTTGTVSRVDPTSARLLQVIDAGSSADAVAVGGGSVWVVDARDGSVVEVSPTAGRVTRRIPVPGVGNDVAFGAGAVWVTRNAGGIARIDPASGNVVEIETGGGTSGVCATDRGVWAVNGEDGTVSRLDPHRGRVIATLEAPTRPYRVACDSDSVWGIYLGRSIPGHDGED